MKIKRIIEDTIINHLFKGKIIIIYGARQVGKTTILKIIQEKYQGDSIYLNCDEPDIKANLTNINSTQLKQIFGNKKLILIDEAQRVTNIGITLKLIADNLDVQVIATGSSSFELSNKITEPLTGRKFEFHLYPISTEELLSIHSDLEVNRLLERRLIFGMYPEIVTASNDSASLLKSIARSYLFKDILSFNQIRNSDAVEKLLKALALQVGNEVSYNELANLIGIDKKTVEHYIKILEESFIIFRLKPLTTNRRHEIKSLKKIYFWDNGIRNVIINNLNMPDIRQDTGSLWENFIISERMKFLSNNQIDINTWFWRNHQKREIDFIEEENMFYSCYEFKWDKEKAVIPADFTNNYKNHSYNVISKNNFLKFVSKQA